MIRVNRRVLWLFAFCLVLSLLHSCDYTFDNLPSTIPTTAFSIAPPNCASFLTLQFPDGSQKRYFKATDGCVHIQGLVNGSTYKLKLTSPLGTRTKSFTVIIDFSKVTGCKTCEEYKALPPAYLFLVKDSADKRLNILAVFEDKSGRHPLANAALIVWMHNLTYDRLCKITTDNQGHAWIKYNDSYAMKYFFAYCCYYKGCGFEECMKALNVPFRLWNGINNVSQLPNCPKGSSGSISFPPIHTYPVIESYVIVPERPSLSSLFCFPAMLVLSFLFAAMLLMGRNPLASLDLTAIGFRKHTTYVPRGYQMNIRYSGMQAFRQATMLVQEIKHEYSKTSKKSNAFVRLLKAVGRVLSPVSIYKRTAKKVKARWRAFVRLPSDFNSKNWGQAINDIKDTFTAVPEIKQTNQKNLNRPLENVSSSARNVNQLQGQAGGGPISVAGGTGTGIVGLVLAILGRILQDKEFQKGGFWKKIWVALKDSVLEGVGAYEIESTIRFTIASALVYQAAMEILNTKNVGTAIKYAEKYAEVCTGKKFSELSNSEKKRYINYFLSEVNRTVALIKALDSGSIHTEILKGLGIFTLNTLGLAIGMNIGYVGSDLNVFSDKVIKLSEDLYKKKCISSTRALSWIFSNKLPKEKLKILAQKLHLPEKLTLVDLHTLSALLDILIKNGRISEKDLQNIPGLEGLCKDMSVSPQELIGILNDFRGDLESYQVDTNTVKFLAQLTPEKFTKIVKDVIQNVGALYPVGPAELDGSGKLFNIVAKSSEQISEFSKYLKNIKQKSKSGLVEINKTELLQQFHDEPWLLNAFIQSGAFYSDRGKHNKITNVDELKNTKNIWVDPSVVNQIKEQYAAFWEKWKNNPYFSEQSLAKLAMKLPGMKEYTQEEVQKLKNAGIPPEFNSLYDYARGGVVPAIPFVSDILLLYKKYPNLKSKIPEDLKKAAVDALKNLGFITKKVDDPDAVLNAFSSSVFFDKEQQKNWNKTLKNYNIDLLPIGKEFSKQSILMNLFIVNKLKSKFPLVSKKVESMLLLYDLGKKLESLQKSGIQLGETGNKLVVYSKLRELLDPNVAQNDKIKIVHELSTKYNSYLNEDTLQALNRYLKKRHSTIILDKNTKKVINHQLGKWQSSILRSLYGYGQNSKSPHFIINPATTIGYVATHFKDKKKVKIVCALLFSPTIIPSKKETPNTGMRSGLTSSQMKGAPEQVRKHRHDVKNVQQTQQRKEQEKSTESTSKKQSIPSQQRHAEEVKNVQQTEKSRKKDEKRQ